MKVTGSAIIEDGQLMLTGFSTSEGPDLHVYLAKGMEVSKGIEISKIDLKKMEQTFDVSKADIADYDTILIYCQKAHVIFGAAMLQ
ncbi:lipoprotein [Paenibacillus sabinae T27]|uniref:Lipoprotein n=2 Tax=Paenibacillus sabinae TaxID=365617 RepID=X5A0N6_9BACL|nr:lipoprotein [Paenibacillus sabinae T27]